MKVFKEKDVIILEVEQEKKLEDVLNSEEFFYSDLILCIDPATYDFVIYDSYDGNWYYDNNRTFEMLSKMAEKGVGKLEGSYYFKKLDKLDSERLNKIFEF